MARLDLSLPSPHAGAARLNSPHAIGQTGGRSWLPYPRWLTPGDSSRLYPPLSSPATPREKGGQPSCLATRSLITLTKNGKEVPL